MRLARLVAGEHGRGPAARRHGSGGALLGTVLGLVLSLLVASVLWLTVDSDPSPAPSAPGKPGTTVPSTDAATTAGARHRPHAQGGTS